MGVGVIIFPILISVTAAVALVGRARSSRPVPFEVYALLLCVAVFQSWVLYVVGVR